MKALIWLILLLSAAALVAVGALGHGGYALLVVPPWRIEISLNFLPVILVVAFLLFYAFLRTYAILRGLPDQARAYQQQRRKEQAYETLFLANRLLFEGRVGQALKKASEAYLAGAPKGLSSLIAARAAQRMRHRNLVQPWVERAIEDDREVQAAALMLLAETELDQRQYDAALLTLKKLQKSAGRHLAALRLELRAQQGLGNWEEVIRLARQLAKREAISESHALAVFQKAHHQIVSAWGRGAKALLAYLRSIPEQEKSPQLIQSAALALSRISADREAEELLEQWLDEQIGGPWHDDLVMLYGKLQSHDITRKIARAESWLKRQPKDASLLHVLGLLCVRQRLWGKAQSYFEAALSIQESSETYLALAQLHEQLERPELAARQYRQAALMKTIS